MVQGIAGRSKRYVEVVARYRTDGTVKPLSITWADGRVFSIDRVLGARQAASLKVGGMGVRYIVRIGNRTTCLFFEDPRWFVEEILPEGQVGVPAADAWDEGELDGWGGCSDFECACDEPDERSPRMGAADLFSA